VARESQTRAVDTAASIPDRSRVPGIVRSWPLQGRANTHTHTHAYYCNELCRERGGVSQTRAVDTAASIPDRSRVPWIVRSWPLQGRANTHTHTRIRILYCNELCRERGPRWRVADTRARHSSIYPRPLLGAVDCALVPTPQGRANTHQVGPGHPMKSVRLRETLTSPA
jgi:hypothetical protein